MTAKEMKTMVHSMHFRISRRPAASLSIATLMLASASLNPTFGAQRANAQEPEPADAQVEPTGWLTLPDEPVGRLWASVGPETAPWDVFAGPPALEQDMTSPAGWTSWADALADARTEGKRRDAAAELCALAVADARPEDAFAWAQAFGADDPEAIAGTLPYLFPGIPRGTALGAGGAPAAMPKGARLTPQLPPSTAKSEFDGLVWRSATARSLRIADTTFDLILKVDGSGVVLELVNINGPAVKAVVSLPAPTGYRLKSMYVDWELQSVPEGATEKTYNWANQPIEIVIERPDPDDPSEALSLFGRLGVAKGAIPQSPKSGGALPRQLKDAGLILEVDVGDARPWDQIAAAFGRSGGVPANVTRLALTAPPQRQPETSGGQIRPSGVVINLRESRGVRVDEQRRLITGAIEASIRDSIASKRKAR